MIIVVDANVIVADPLLTGAKWERLRESTAGSYARVVAPAIALKEAVARHQDHLETIAGGLRTEGRKAPRSVRDLIDAAREECDRISETYGTELHQRWSDLGFEIVDAPSVDHAEVARRAIERQPPFDSKGNGYRDTLHWLTLLAVAAEEPDEDVVLLSADKAFLDKSGGLVTQLEDEFAETSQGHITLCRGLHELGVPGPRESTPRPAEEFTQSLSSTLAMALKEEYALHGVSGARLGVPDADWFTVESVDAVMIRNLTSYNPNRRGHAELDFDAVLTLTLDASYVTGDSEDDLDIVHNSHQSRIRVSGSALGNTADSTVVSLGDLEVRATGFDIQQMLDRLQSDWASAAADLTEEERHTLAEYVAKHGAARLWVPPPTDLDGPAHP